MEETVDHEQWKRDSAVRQQLLFKFYGDRDRDRISYNELDKIRTKISWYVFKKDYDDLTEGEQVKEKSTVDSSIDKLKSASGSEKDLLLGCMYVDILLKEEKTFRILPVLRTVSARSETKKTIFYEVYTHPPPHSTHMRGYE